MLHIQARRQSKPGFGFEVDQSLYMQFASGFAYEETLDQANAIEATLYDMQQVKPMDRLVCGDVGFGKTEVAMRAAFVAVQNGKQVAVLVPTTLLAQQHYESLKTALPTGLFVLKYYHALVQIKPIRKILKILLKVKSILWWAPINFYKKMCSLKI